MIPYKTIMMIIAVYIMLIHECILKHQCQYHLKCLIIYLQKPGPVCSLLWIRTAHLDKKRLFDPHVNWTDNFWTQWRDCGTQGYPWDYDAPLLYPQFSSFISVTRIISKRSINRLYAEHHMNKEESRSYFLSEKVLTAVRTS